jgi:hypothetical protein
VRLPPGRWLVRPGRTLPGHLYLLDGRVRLWTHQLTGAGESRRGARARRALLPWAAGAASDAVRLLRTDQRLVLQTAVGAPTAEHPGPRVDDELDDEWMTTTLDDGDWQRRFLGSPLLQRLSLQCSGRGMLRAMVPVLSDAGARLLEPDAPAECCYVLCKGRAEIVAPGDGARLATVLPGDLFGEDALITGAVRNASVVMSAAGASMRLAADRFEAWLLDAVIVAVDAPGGRRLVDLDGMTRGALAVPLARIRDVAG